MHGAGSAITSLTNESGGRIEGGGSGGIVLYSGATIGAIENSGLISTGNEDGIQVSGSNSAITSLTNESGGTIEGRGNSAGIFVSGGGTIGAIENSGLISGNGYGIKVTGAGSEITSLTNESGGSISANYSGGIYVQSGGSIGAITNESGGTITGYYTGIVVGNGATIGAIDNSGLISGTNGDGIRSSAATAPSALSPTKAAGRYGDLHRDCCGQRCHDRRHRQ